MWKTAATIISALVVLGGLLLRLPWTALDWTGRVLTMLDSPQTFARFVDWISAHPIIAVDFGPWILMTAGLGSLVITHRSYFSRLTTKLRQIKPQPLEQSEAGKAATPLLETPVVEAKPKPASFRELFDNDFKHLKITKEIPVGSLKGATDYTIPIHLMLDYTAGAKFLVVFLKRNTNGFASGMLVLNEMDYILETMDDISIQTRIPGDTSESLSKNYIFSNVVYFYMEYDLSLESQANLEKAFKERGMSTQFRGHAYHILHWHDSDIVKAISSKDTAGSAAAAPDQMPSKRR